MTDSDSNIKNTRTYEALGFTDHIKAALRTIAPESQLMTVAQLASLDQFHTRGNVSSRLNSPVDITSQSRPGSEGPYPITTAGGRC